MLSYKVCKSALEVPWKTFSFYGISGSDQADGICSVSAEFLQARPNSYRFPIDCYAHSHICTQRATFNITLWGPNMVTEPPAVGAPHSIGDINPIFLCKLA